MWQQLHLTVRETPTGVKVSRPSIKRIGIHAVAGFTAARYAAVKSWDAQIPIAAAAVYVAADHVTLGLGKSFN